MTPRYIIQTTKTGHCKRGPLVCGLCKEMNQEQICLLDIDPPDRGMVQRRVIEVEVKIDGVREWREYDIVRVFDNVEDARMYAVANEVILTEN
jgi:hypothetical protein